MLPRRLRVRARAEFAAVTRRGRKASCGSVVVYRLSQQHGSASRAGLIVGRTVGNAVVRHRVSRVLRAVLAEQMPDHTGELVVVRALPAAATTSYAQMRDQVALGLARTGRVSASTSPVAPGTPSWDRDPVAP